MLVVLLAVPALATHAQVVFSPPMNVSNSSGNTQNQQIAVDAHANVNLVWADNSSGNYAIFLSRSSDSGATFSTPRSISKHAQSTASGPQITVDASGNVSVAWVDASLGNSQIFFSRSADGQSFSTSLNLFNDSGKANEPQIASDSAGNIFVAWALPSRPRTTE